MIALHSLKSARGARRRHVRLGIGEGSGHGQTATRGQKGQRSRSGDGKLVGFEGGQTPLLRRVPKRGFNNKKFQIRYQTIPLARIEKVFKNQVEVNLEALERHGLADGDQPIKILGDGQISRPYKITAHAFSARAEEKIKKAGGLAQRPASK